MNDKTIKFLALLLLLNIAIACAFSLLSPSNPVKFSPQTRIQTVSQPLPALAEMRSLRISRPVELSPQNGDEILDSTTNEEDVLTRLRNWARNDPESALNWGRQQPDNEERSEVLADACFQIAQADPQRAVALAGQLNLSGDAVLENLAQQWAAKDLTTARTWIQAQPAGDQRDALATGMAFIWSQTEPVGAAQFVVEQMSSGPAQDEAAMMVLHQWILADPAAAGAWVQEFPEGPLRDRAMNELSGIAQYQQGLARSK